ncbi:hypothetical protein K438DRAFT_1970225 [Mycena galopus ATCC 62051]|nr:hypothetical protein K438DRAFT_1970225 [Mycena galopus ATCC 62051]
MIAGVVFIVGLWAVIAGKGVDTSNNLPLYIGCNYPVGRSQGISQASAWAGVVVFHCVIFLLTLNKVFHHHRDGKGLVTVLLRDGSVYFGVMVMSELSNILTLVLGSVCALYTRLLNNIYEHVGPFAGTVNFDEIYSNQDIFDNDITPDAQPPRSGSGASVGATITRCEYDEGYP